MKFDLEERLIKFGVSVLDLSEKMPNTKGSNHVSGQLIRSATAPPLLYGEVNAAESTADFIHKMGVALKELRETRNNLKMIQLIPDSSDVEKFINENEELIRIFGSSINTVKRRNNIS